MSDFTKVNEKIEKTVVRGYQKIEDSVVPGYQKVEDTFVDGHKKIEDKFIDTFFRKEDETREDTKERLKKEQEEIQKKEGK